MALVSVASNNAHLAVVGTEQSLTQQTGIGIYVLVVDTHNMESGDAVTIRVKTKYGAAGVSRVAYELNYADAQAEPNKYSVPVPIDTEIICTIEQTAGVARTFPWNLLRA